ncbi:MAG: hypothetical protein VB108_05435 [Anaerolineaceae bacterium]|nr:hypothetical protein [Anaerolineaceae bacterium]
MMPHSIPFTALQQAFLDEKKSGLSFLEGPFGCGKTSAATQRMLQLTGESKKPFSSVLVLAPQYSLLRPYIEARLSNQAHLRQAETMTFSSLVRRNIALFWPVIAEEAGFANPFEPPKFLTIETAQFYFSELIDPLIDKGLFSTITIPRNRIYSQLLDNLNKAALIPFDYQQVGSRLKGAWSGSPEQLVVYDEVQVCLNAFRTKCLQENLLDYSLQVEIFRKQLWPQKLFRKYMRSRYSDLIYDNIEEEPPIIHDFIEEWLPDLDSACLIFDSGAGYRKFLAADPISARRFRPLARAHVELKESLVNPLEIIKARTYFDFAHQKTIKPGTEVFRVFAQPERLPSFVPELLDWAAEKIESLIEGGAEPSQIVVISPYLSSTFAFYLEEKLRALGLRSTIARGSAPLRDDPLVKVFLNFYCLAANQPDLAVSKDDLIDLLSISLGGINRIQASIFGSAICGSAPAIHALPAQELIEENVLKRLNPLTLQQYGHVRQWLKRFEVHSGFGSFISQIFGELLTQPGYGLEGSALAGETAGHLMQGFKKFEEALPFGAPERLKAKQYLETVRKGLLAGLYGDETSPAENAILITPVLNFILRNKAVDYQFWMNTGSAGWYERLEQPLTQAHVLSRQWKAGQIWTASDENRLAKETLSQIMQGLLERCKKQVFLGISLYDESGNQEKSLLLQVLQGLFRKAIKGKDHA